MLDLHFLPPALCQLSAFSSHCPAGSIPGLPAPRRCIRQALTSQSLPAGRPTVPSLVGKRALHSAECAENYSPDFPSSQQ